jgi:hypothetical protein
LQQFLVALDIYINNNEIFQERVMGSLSNISMREQIIADLKPVKQIIAGNIQDKERASNNITIERGGQKLVADESVMPALKQHDICLNEDGTLTFIDLGDLQAHAWDLFDGNKNQEVKLSLAGNNLVVEVREFSGETAVAKFNLETKKISIMPKEAVDLKVRYEGYEYLISPDGKMQLFAEGKMHNLRSPNKAVLKLEEVQIWLKTWQD